MDQGPHDWPSDLRHEFALAGARLDRVFIKASRVLGLPRNPEWRELLALTESHTLVDPIRRVSLLRLISRLNLEGVPGSFVECGVAAGGVAALLGVCACRSQPTRDLWLFDSFAGLPEPTFRDGAPAIRFAHNRGKGLLEPIGECVGSLDEVKSYLFETCRLPEARCHFVPGWFQHTVPSFDGGAIALLHVDADWYESVRVCLSALWPFVSPGGYVVVDDYGHWEGARRATREFLAGHGKGILLHRKGYSQAYFRKPVVAASWF